MVPRAGLEMVARRKISVLPEIESQSSSPQTKVNLVIFQVLTATNMKMAVLWDVAPCSLVEVHRRFRGACCLRHHGDQTRLYGATSLTTVIVKGNVPM
jgi:hypothetical protein